MKSLKFAVVQSGYGMYGAGYTRKQAISDAQKWLEKEDGVSWSFRQVENLIKIQPVYGDFQMLSSDDEEFDSYMENQSGYTKRGHGWYIIQ